MDWPGELEGAQEVDIETSRSADAPVHRTTIWPAVEGGEVYVRSLRGGAGRWYQELIANPSAVVHVGGAAIAVRGVVASDSASIERATAGFKRKYADSEYLATMIRDEILETTVRLEPR